MSLESQAADMAAKTRTASAQVAQGSSATVGLALERIRDQLGATDVVLWNAAGQPIGSAGQSRFSLNPERPSTALLRSVREQRAVTQIEGLDDIADPNAVQMARVKVLVLVTNPGLGLLTEPRFCKATLPLPPRWCPTPSRSRRPTASIRACAGAGRPAPHVCGHAHAQPLPGGVWRGAAGGVAGQPAGAPLLVLAEGVREVAAGNLSPKAALPGKDELGGLTRSFAMMTQQLADARAAVEQSMVKVDAARSNLQTILDNLTAGVIVLGRAGSSALPTPAPPAFFGHPWRRTKADHCPKCLGWLILRRRGAAFSGVFGDRDRHGLDHWQQPFELHASSAGAGSTRPAWWRGAQSCPMGATVGFDDISEIVSAQRAQAWGEVARRLAHEIKNPLTPSSCLPNAWK